MIDPFKLQYTAAVKNERIKHEIVTLCMQRSTGINIAVIAVIAVSYCSGLFLITRPQLWLGALGVVPLLSSMLMSWYLSHDCAHNLVFQRKRKNHILGEVLSWLNGVSYFRFDEYCKYHIQHHTKQVDFIGVDINAALAKLPRWLAQSLVALEVAYIPSMYVFIKVYALIAILRDPDRSYRRRVTGMLLLTICFFVILGSVSVAAVAFYLLVISIRTHCVRFVDAFQHSYMQIVPDKTTPPKGKRYEQHHTFSFPVARKLTGLNLLILNFGYHNAHHALPSCPWYNLPALDTLITSSGTVEGVDWRTASPTQLVSFVELLRGYHRHRRYRITTTDEGQAYDDALQFSMTKFTGAFTDNLLG